MGKNMIQKMQERLMVQAAVHEEAMVMFNRGLCQDAAVLAAHNVFGMGPKKCIEFIMEYVKIRNELNDIIDKDYAMDPEIVYAQEHIDDIMRRIYELPGEDNHWMPPFKQRYGLERGGTRTTVDISEKQLTKKMKERIDAELAMEESLRSGTVIGTVEKMEEQRMAVLEAEAAAEYAGEAVSLEGLQEAMDKKAEAVKKAEEAMGDITKPAMGCVVDQAMCEWAAGAEPKKAKPAHSHKPRKGGKKK